MFDFRRFAASHHLSTRTEGHSHCRPGWIQAQCPWCGSEGSHGGWYLGWSLEEGLFHCWRCGSVRFKPTIAALARVSVREVGRIIAEYQTDTAPKRTLPPARLKTLTKPPGYGPLWPAHRRYLEGRGFDPDQLVKTWEIAASGPYSRAAIWGDWSWRVVIPIFNAEGRAVAYQGRHIGEVQPKYRFMPDSLCLEDPRGLLYGLPEVPEDRVLAVEGVPGVWRFGEGTVATLGIDWSWEHFYQLRHFKHRFILFDPEPKAQAKAQALAANLALFPGTTEIITVDQDIDKLPEDEIISIRRELLDVTV